MPVIKHNLTKAQRRQRRVRAAMTGTAKQPRVSVFRSNKYMYVQAIDDVAGKTIAAAHSKQVTKASKKGQTKTDVAAATAKQLAEQLKKQKVTKAIFDRGANKYHGRVKAVAETLRSEGVTV